MRKKSVRFFDEIHTTPGHMPSVNERVIALEVASRFCQGRTAADVIDMAGHMLGFLWGNPFAGLVSRGNKAPAPPTAQRSKRKWPIQLRRKVASEYLDEVHGVPIAPGTLAKYATIGGGPSYRKSGRTVLYTPKALDNWVAKKLAEGAAKRKS